MITLDELFELGSEIVAREIEDAIEAQTQQQAKDDAEIERRANLIAAAVGVDLNTLMADLGLRYRSSRYDHEFALNYLGSTASVGVFRPRGQSLTGPESVVFSQEYKAATPLESLAKFVARAQHDYAEDKSELLKTLREMERPMRLSQYDQHRAWNDAEVQSAAVACLLRFVPGDNASESQLDYWLDNARSFDGANGLRDTIANVTIRTERLRKKNRLLTYIRDRVDPRDGSALDRIYDDNCSWDSLPLTRDSIDVLRLAARADDLDSDPEVALAIQKLEAWLDERLRASEREQQRSKLEEAIFQPFRYYEVNFGVIGTDEDGGHMVEVQSFYTLHEQTSADGYYTSVHGTPRKPVHVAEIAQIECRTVEQLRYLTWRGRAATEFGEICVTPEGAELI